MAIKNQAGLKPLYDKRLLKTEYFNLYARLLTKILSYFATLYGVVAATYVLIDVFSRDDLNSTAVTMFSLFAFVALSFATLSLFNKDTFIYIMLAVFSLNIPAAVSAVLISKFNRQYDEYLNSYDNRRIESEKTIIALRRAEKEILDIEKTSPAPGSVQEKELALLRIYTSKLNDGYMSLSEFEQKKQELSLH